MYVFMRKVTHALYHWICVFFPCVASFGHFDGFWCTSFLNVFWFLTLYWILWSRKWVRCAGERNSEFFHYIHVNEKSRHFRVDQFRLREWKFTVPLMICGICNWIQKSQISISLVSTYGTSYPVVGWVVR